MGILSGYIKTKRFRKQAEGYILQSELTMADSVEFEDGSTLTEKLTTINEEVNNKAPSEHEQSASTITAGTFKGKVLGNATSAAALGEKQFRNIYAGTGELVSGTSSLTTGNIYIQYE